MSYHLEQGVYFLSDPAFETTSGLGLRAASLKDRESVQAMCAIASRLDFYSERTEYSFLYSGRLGFALTATTTRMPAGESRRTPYIHMIFSGQHPHDAPGNYGFRAVYETGERDVSGLMRRAEVEPLPPWELRDISREQLAWLICKLWSLLSSCGSDTQPLLLSPETLPREWEPPLQLAQLMCALAELVPPFLRRLLSGTTAAPAVGGADAFLVQLSASSEAYRLDDLPALELRDPEDYFKSFCLKMAQAYQEAPETFRLITDRVDQGGLARLRQPTAERQMLAACCAVMEWEPPWCLEGAALSTLQKRVQSMLPNQREDRAFWEEQAQLLRSRCPPGDLPELLKWFEQERKNLEDQKSFLARNYALSPERFRRQSGCLKGAAALVNFIWECPEEGEMAGLWEPEGLESPHVFYPYLTEQLCFWEDMPLKEAGADKARRYFSARLDQGPDAALEDLAPLLQRSWRLLDPDSLGNRLAHAVQKKTRLPELSFLRKIPKDLLRRSSLKQLLTSLWMREKPAGSDAFEQWKESGRLLEISGYNAILEEYIKKQIDSLETIQDAAAFTERFLPGLSALQARELDLRIEFLAKQAGTPEKSEYLEIRKRIASFQGGEYKNSAVWEKREQAGLDDWLRQSDLPGLLRMAKEDSGINMDCAETAALWRKQIQLRLEAPEKSGSLTPEDIGPLNSAVQVLEKTDQELAHRLCDRFLRECYPSLRDLRSIRDRYTGFLEKEIQRHARQLAAQCPLKELYESERDGSFYQVRASSEAWANLTGRDRAEICAQALEDARARQIYKTLCASEEPFCRLLQRLCGPPDQQLPFDEEEMESLLDCLAGLTAMLPEQKEALEKLLRFWQQNPIGPNRRFCLKLFRKMDQAEPRPERRQIKCALKSWKSVFPDKPQRTVLKDAWKRRRKRWGGPCCWLPFYKKPPRRRTPPENKSP